ncbi:MAG: ABC transporter permease, partial [Candidatus Zixiibacteriota bacterium]
VMGIFGQMHYIQSMDVGFNKDHVVMFGVPGQAAAHTATIKNKLLTNPDIENVTVSAYSLIQWQSSAGISWEGKDPANTFDVGLNSVDYDYASTFQIEMAEGRFFSPEFPSDRSDAFVINEACVRAMDVTEPIGRRITIAPGSSMEAKGTVVGVIRDHHTESARTEIRPFLLKCTERGSLMCARINPQNMAASLDFIRGTIAEVAPDAGVYFRFYDELSASLYQDEILTGVVVIYVMIIAIFISCLGLFGLAAFTARQRAKEVSIRRVLGASVAGVVSLLSREFVILVLVAGVIASPFAYYTINRWLEGFAFRMTLGPGMFIFAIIAACVIGLITVIGQVYRAAVSNPAETLRQE